MALKYNSAGWFPIPLPPRMKESPPTGFTGRKSTWPDEEQEQVTEWLTSHPAQSNIGLWLHEGVIGLDVDAYVKGGKDYKGGQSYDELVAKLGPLPETWTSTARKDGISGIRFFRVPSGLVFPGKAGKNIDIIYRGYRYAVVYPSHHPEGGQYQWYRPGMNLDGTPAQMSLVTQEDPDGGFRHQLVRDETHGEYPSPGDLPLMPDNWVQFLTLGKKTDRPMDVDSTIDDLDNWVLENFPNPTLPKAKWCKGLAKVVNTHVQNVKDNADSHDHLINAHWSLINMGAEGHHGWGTAMKLFNNFYTRNTIKRGKRMPNEVAGEIFRSKYNAIRQLKAKAEDFRASKGIELFSPRCGCFNESEVPEESRKPSPKPTGAAQDPSDYRFNDDGNAEHLHDLFGDNLGFITGFEQWMLWDGQRWNRDLDGLARRCYWRVRDRQESAVDQLWEYARGMDPESPEAKQAREKAKKFADLARSSGTNRGANAALEAARSIEGVSISPAKLDVNPNLLGVANGIIEMTESGAVLRKASHDDYVTLNTGVPYMDPVQIKQAGGDVAKGRALWYDYLDRFIPDLELRRFVQKVMGYCMLGVNAERLAIFLYGDTSTGKSVMLKAVMGAMGEYASTVNLNSVFKDRDLNPALAAVLPKRIITASEAGSNNHLHADLFKRITGNDHISAELKFSNDIQVRIPAFTPIIATNGAPTIEGADTALKKRLLVIPFNHRINADEDRKTASDDIGRICNEVVFSWLVEGWRMYAAEGLDPREWPDAVKSDTLDFSASLSDMGEFVADMIIPDRDEKLDGGDAFDAYTRWAAEQRIKESDVYSRRRFAVKMKEAGFPPKNVKIDGRNVRGYSGIKLAQGNLKVKHIVG